MATAKLEVSVSGGQVSAQLITTHVPWVKVFHLLDFSFLICEIKVPESKY